MRTLVIGDIHGCLRAFDSLLDAVRPAPADQLILLGDYVDRGPDSRGVIDRVLGLTRSHRNLITLTGNHEDMMLEARADPYALRGWCLSGGEATLRSYAPNAATSLAIEQVPPEHWQFLERCRDWFETGTHIFVHGYVDPDAIMTEQQPAVLRWRKLRDARPHRSGKTVICGHTAQRDGRPAHLGFAICIDTFAYGGGWLTCLDASSGRLWQANQQGHLQVGHIDSYRR